MNLFGQVSQDDHIDIGQQGHGAQAIDDYLVGRLLAGGGVTIEEPFQRGSFDAQRGNGIFGGGGAYVFEAEGQFIAANEMSGADNAGERLHGGGVVGGLARVAPADEDGAAQDEEDELSVIILPGQLIAGGEIDHQRVGLEESGDLVHGQPIQKGKGVEQRHSRRGPDELGEVGPVAAGHLEVLLD